MLRKQVKQGTNVEIALQGRMQRTNTLGGWTWRQREKRKLWNRTVWRNRPSVSMGMEKGLLGNLLQRQLIGSAVRVNGLRKKGTLG